MLFHALFSKPIIFLCCQASFRILPFPFRIQPYLFYSETTKYSWDYLAEPIFAGAIFVCITGSVEFLCTGAPLYAPNSLLLISNEFWMGGGRLGSRRGRIKGVKGWVVGWGRGRGRGQSRVIKFLNAPERPSRVIKFLFAHAPPPPTVWALDHPTIHPF